MTDNEKQDFSYGLAMFIILCVFAVAILFGCGERRTTASVPGCPSARIEIPKGCYTQAVEGGIQVRCSDGTNSTYICKH